MRTKRFVEPTEEQYLILNALETLEVLQYRLYDEYTGNWLIITPSPVLPISFLLPDGDVVPSTWVSES